MTRCRAATFFGLLLAGDFRLVVGFILRGSLLLITGTDRLWRIIGARRTVRRWKIELTPPFRITNALRPWFVNLDLCGHVNTSISSVDRPKQGV